jgi:hypothetical protein
MMCMMTHLDGRIMSSIDVLEDAVIIADAPKVHLRSSSGCGQTSCHAAGSPSTHDQAVVCLLADAAAAVANVESADK